eukprot:6204138-Pleurochrysis_carterae.AAC.2
MATQRGILGPRRSVRKRAFSAEFEMPAVRAVAPDLGNLMSDGSTTLNAMKHFNQPARYP